MEIKMGNTQVKQEKTSHKKSYNTPKLSVFGTIKQLTQSNAPGSSSDNGNTAMRS